MTYLFLGKYVWHQLPYLLHWYCLLVTTKIQLPGFGTVNHTEIKINFSQQVTHIKITIRMIGQKTLQLQEKSETSQLERRKVLYKPEEMISIVCN